MTLIPEHIVLAGRNDDHYNLICSVNNSKVFHKELIKNRHLSPRHQIPRGLGVTRKRGSYHVILAGSITTG